MTAFRDAVRQHDVVTALLPRCSFPQPGSHVDCAVSGGADSLALLLLASRTQQPVVAWHVDHGIRRSSADDFALVLQVAQDLGANAELRAVNVELGPNLEARAREARFAVLPTDVLTGHTADDQAETVIINLLRGSGTAGLAGMRHDRHPLLRIRRSETRALCAEVGVQPLHDPMNDDDRFQRVRLRNEVIPLLKEIAQRDVVDLISRQAETLRDDNDLLDELAAMIDVSDARALAGAPVALARRAVRQWLSDPLPPDAATVERVLAVARGEAIACEVGRGRQVRRSHQRLGLHNLDVL